MAMRDFITWTPSADSSGLPVYSYSLRVSTPSACCFSISSSCPSPLSFCGCESLWADTSSFTLSLYSWKYTSRHVYVYIHIYISLCVPFFPCVGGRGVHVHGQACRHASALSRCTACERSKEAPLHGGMVGVSNLITQATMPRHCSAW